MSASCLCEQVVKGAPKGDPTDVGGLFDRARQAGARQGTQEDLPGQAEQPSGSRAFQGSSNTLAGTLHLAILVIKLSLFQGAAAALSEGFMHCGIV